MLYVCDSQRNLVCLPYTDANMHAMGEALGLTERQRSRPRRRLIPYAGAERAAPAETAEPPAFKAGAFAEGRCVIPEERAAEIARLCITVKPSDTEEIVRGLLDGVKTPPGLPRHRRRHSSFQHLAQLNGLTPSTLYWRRRRGWSLAETLLIPIADPDVLADRAHDAGLTTDLVRKRMNTKGLTAAEALAIPLGACHVRGPTTLAARAHAAGLASTTVRDRIGRGMTVEAALAMPARPTDQEWRGRLKWRTRGTTSVRTTGPVPPSHVVAATRYGAGQPAQIGARSLSEPSTK